MWIILSGSQYCHYESNGTCVTDGIGFHGNAERCTIAARNTMYVTATYFQTETYYDYITIGSQRWSGANGGPSNVEMNAGDRMTWYSDGSVVRGGWIICGSTNMMPFMPPPPPPVPPRRRRRPLLPMRAAPTHRTTHAPVFMAAFASAPSPRASARPTRATTPSHLAAIGAKCRSAISAS